MILHLCYSQWFQKWIHDLLIAAELSLTNDFLQVHHTDAAVIGSRSQPELTLRGLPELSCELRMPAATIDEFTMNANATHHSQILSPKHLDGPEKQFHTRFLQKTCIFSKTVQYINILK